MNRNDLVVTVNGDGSSQNASQMEPLIVRRMNVQLEMKVQRWEVSIVCCENCYNTTWHRFQVVKLQTEYWCCPYYFH
jgi:hypothetical protein